MCRQTLDAARKLRRRLVGRQNRPMQRRRWIEGRGQIVAQRGAERRLVTGLDPERVDQRRRMRARRRRQQLRERLRLGIQLLAAALRGLEGSARGLLGDLGRTQGLLGDVGGGARARHLGLGSRHQRGGTLEDPAR